MNKQRKELSYLELSNLLEKEKNLKGLEKRYYNFLPDVCTMSEHTQIEELNKGSITKIGRSRLRTTKRKLIELGLLQLELLPNGKRNNLKHKLLKTIPINILYEEGEREERRKEKDYKKIKKIVRKEEIKENNEFDDIEEPLNIPYFLEDDVFEYSDYTIDIDWNLLQSYTAEDLNRMSKLELVQLYMNCGFVVLPTHYPIFTDDGVKCSCKEGFDCLTKGKHSKVYYKKINSFNYQYYNKRHLDYFKKNPDVNIGFKVIGYSALDVDNRHGGDRSLAVLCDEYNIDFSGTLTVKCSNGQHIYLNNRYLKNNAGVVGDSGLDVRSEGGFLVAPGSVHKSGTIYQWNLISNPSTAPAVWFESALDNEKSDFDDEQSDFDNNQLDSANNDSDLDSPNDESNIELDSETNQSKTDINQKKTKSSFSKDLVKSKLLDIKLPKTLTSDYVIREGARELTLFKWGCSQRGRGATADEIYDILLTIRDTYCEAGSEPVTDAEIKSIADSVAQYPTNEEKLSMELKA